MRLPVLAAVATSAAALLSAAVPAAHADAPAQSRSGMTTHIIGGAPASSTRGAVALFLTVDGGAHFSCSATLLDANSVLTARHCVDKYPLNSLRVGSVNLQSGGTVVKPKSFVYNPSADLAVITLTSKVSGPTVTLATTRPAVGETHDIYGWGHTVCDTKTDPSPVLKTAKVKVTGIETDNYGGIALHSDGVTGTAWRGDSGGPEFNTAGEQVGVASTANCTSFENYTSVADYRSWIVAQAAK